MPIQTINVGTNPNDGTGDTLRAALVKVNANFLLTLAKDANGDVIMGQEYKHLIFPSNTDATGNYGGIQAYCTSYAATTAEIVFERVAANTADIVMKCGTAGAMAERVRINSAGTVVPGGDNTQTMGAASKRWSVVYAGTGTINTSDAREKTAVAPLTAAEIAAAKDLAKEIGTYRFLAAIEVKGEGARNHIGLTVQRAIEVMQVHGLNPYAYGFICFDEWEDQLIEHPAVEAQPATEDTPAVEARAAWTEQVQWAGSRYAFRPDELNLFLARGFEARLAALEGA